MKLRDMEADTRVLAVRSATEKMLANEDWKTLEDVLKDGSTNHKVLSAAISEKDKAMEEGSDIPPIIAAFNRNDGNVSFRLGWWKSRATSALGDLARARAKIDALQAELDAIADTFKED